MSLSKADEIMHENYEEHLTSAQRLVVDATFEVARSTLVAAGIHCSGDDRAESFVAAIVRYIYDSDAKINKQIIDGRQAAR